MSSLYFCFSRSPFIVVAGLTLGLLIKRQAGRDEARPSDAIVVLGAAQWDGKPSPVLQARLDHAYDLYAAGLAPKLIVTGGVGVGIVIPRAT